MTEGPMDLMAFKLRRADDRLRGLKRQLDTFARSHPIIVGTELDFGTGWHTSYIDQSLNRSRNDSRSLWERVCITGDPSSIISSGRS